MFKTFNSIVPDNLNFKVQTSVKLADYPEYNLPSLEVPNLSDPTTTSKVAVNEIYDLFNAQRLSGFDNDIVESIRSNILASSPFTDAISKLSDDEILDSIKPRNIQSPSQLIMWSKYIQSAIEDRLQIANVSENSPSDSAAASESDGTLSE